MNDLTTGRCGVSRRAFLTTGLCGLACGAYAGEPSDRVGVLVDLTRCIDCRACENACRVRWGFPGLPRAKVGFERGEGKLSFHTRTLVEDRAVPVKKQCMHCEYPACVSVCPVGALEKTAAGPVIYHEHLCIGCRYCILACPFDIPKYEWESALMPRVGKCDLCSERIASGRSPACVTACPTGTLKFGKRADLLAEAKARMTSLPKRYSQLFGDKVVGGTSWLYLSNTPVEKLGFRADLPDAPLPSLTWKAIAKLPFVIIGVGLLLSVIVRLRSRKGATHA